MCVSINPEHIRGLLRGEALAWACKCIRTDGSESLLEQGRDMKRYLVQRNHTELNSAVPYRGVPSRAEPNSA